MTEKKKIKSLIRFHSANKINNYNAGWGARKENKKKKKIQKNLQNRPDIRIINVLFESLLSKSFPSLGVTVHLTPLRCPPTLCWSLDLLWGSSDSNLVLVLCSCIHCPHLSELVSFPSVGALNGLLSLPQTQSLPSWSCGFNPQLVQLVGGFWVFFLSHTIPGLQLWFYFHLCMWVIHWGFLLWLPWRTWFTPVRARWGGGAAAWVAGDLAAPGTQGRWWLGQQEIKCSRRAWQPVLANTLQHSCLEKRSP